jgi:hypothetical protein
MTSPALPRRVAAFFLQSAISIAPTYTLDWGHAMLAELRHVQGNWAALLWSFGSASVLAKHALLSLIFPSRNRPTMGSGRDLFSKDGPMRRPALAITAACIIASLLFFVAPVFRQAFSVSLLPWEIVFNTDYSRVSPELQSVAKKAEQDHDPEALAFVAFQHPQPSEAVRLADEAVRLDPDLIWVYAVVGVRASPLPNPRLPALERFDPQNAIPYLIAAEGMDIDQVLRDNVPHRPEDEPAAWKSAMAAAFKSAKLDAYSTQRKALDRRVLNRYHVADPTLIVNEAFFCTLPSYGVWDAHRYAELLLASARVLEAQGDAKAASEKYLAIAHFGNLLSPSVSRSYYEQTQQAYTRLAALAAKSSRPEEAAFYSFLADRGSRTQEQASSGYRAFIGNHVARWDADLARRSGVVMLLSGPLLLATMFAVLLRSKSLRLSSLRPGRLAIALGLSSSAAFFVSSAVLRLSYQPYAQILQHFIRDGDETGLTNLRDFLGHAMAPIGSGWLTPRQDYSSYFWFAVIVLCAIALLIAVLRYFQARPRANATI